MRLLLLHKDKRVYSNENEDRKLTFPMVDMSNIPMINL